MFKKYIPYFVLLMAGLLLWFVKKHQRADGFNRNPISLEYTKQTRCKMDCRHITESDVREILKNGTINVAMIEEDSQGKKFPLEGITKDHQNIRVVFEPEGNKMEVLNVLDLSKDQDCDCN